jgi:hypothetical protein
MSEESPQGQQLGPPGRSRLSGPSPKQAPRRGFVNREQRKLHLVITAFNIAKAVAVLALFLLVLGRI